MDTSYSSMWIFAFVCCLPHPIPLQHAQTGATPPLGGSLSPYFPITSVHKTNRLSWLHDPNSSFLEQRIGLTGPLCVMTTSGPITDAWSQGYMVYCSCQSPLLGRMTVLREGSICELSRYPQKVSTPEALYRIQHSGSPINYLDISSLGITGDVPKICSFLTCVQMFMTTNETIE